MSKVIATAALGPSGLHAVDADAAPPPTHMFDQAVFGAWVQNLDLLLRDLQDPIARRRFCSAARDHINSRLDSLDLR